VGILRASPAPLIRAVERQQPRVWNCRCRPAKPACVRRLRKRLVHVFQAGYESVSFQVESQNPNGCAGHLVEFPTNAYTIDCELSQICVWPAVDQGSISGGAAVIQ